MNADLERLEHWLQGSNLVVPPLPEPLSHALRLREECLFSSRIEASNPYNFHDYVEEALQPSLADYVLVAHAGHGSNSYAISYYVAYSGYRILLQLAFGGAYMDNDVAGREIGEVFKCLHELWPALCARDTTAHPFVVASSDFYGGFHARDGVKLSEEHADGSGAMHAIEHLRTELGLDGARPTSGTERG